MIDANPRHARALMNRGRAKLSLKDTEGAVVDLTAAVGADPKLVDAYKARATAYRALKKPELAEIDERRADEVAGSK